MSGTHLDSSWPRPCPGRSTSDAFFTGHVLPLPALLESPSGVEPSTALEDPMPVTKPPIALLAVPAQRAWVRTARRFASTLLVYWGLSADERDTAVLIVGELAANAAQHGRTEMTLGLTLGRDMLYITVTDRGDSRSPKQPGAGHDPDEHGRGMHIVEVLAARVETLHDERGQQVRADLGIAFPQEANRRRSPSTACTSWARSRGQGIAA
ncbi:ATP-binding protein [Streptomyces sp. NPDC021218]|uniref:ATP-binding protein n=1 Tax=unclassified Streptomyces TaxID=2593676 RepID=UPI0036984E2C